MRLDFGPLWDCYQDVSCLMTTELQINHFSRQVWPIFFHYLCRCVCIDYYVRPPYTDIQIHRATIKLQFLNGIYFQYLQQKRQRAFISDIHTKERVTHSCYAQHTFSEWVLCPEHASNSLTPERVTVIREMYTYTCLQSIRSTLAMQCISIYSLRWT